ncbi:activator of basal transcription 1-like [Episyrphus balteatus]|uniref:activator of basal transcription 1-like n=1 Tax=Episyrphus balteatus TaxID=286459 RepID=UPI002485F368|nr:activator of basal transcription 1-like [Episyrphus balteatus]
MKKRKSRGPIAPEYLENKKDEDKEIIENQDNMEEDSGNDPVEPTTQNGSGTEEGEEPSDIEMEQLSKPKKKRKKGIIYVSNLPKHMNVTRIREILGGYGQIGRVFLQPEKMPVTEKQKKRKRLSRHFTEGWVEFLSKRTAKQIVQFLNNKQISTRKKSQFYDSLWSMKYLPRFKWVHLTERMNYEQAVHKQRLMTEVSQARKETSFFQNNLDQSEYIKKKNKMNNKEKKSS